MSKLLPKLAHRDGIQWPVPLGTWTQYQHVSHLGNIAENLDVSQESRNLSLAKSLPTPWARLLLFEEALYRTTHPLHVEIRDQWRGLLGVLALANPLRLKLRTKSLRLNEHQSSWVIKSFSDLRPQYLISNTDEETGKWDQFELILVDDKVLGATSARTLVFTSATQQPYPYIPFISENGSLSDPVAYYKKSNDHHFLELLSFWMRAFIDDLTKGQLLEWLGKLPSQPGTRSPIRMHLLISQLMEWQHELDHTKPPPSLNIGYSLFQSSPYNVIKGLSDPPTSGASDLFLRGRKDVIICYGANKKSKLIDKHGQEVTDKYVKIYDGHHAYVSRPLPTPFTFLPPTVKVIEDPLSFFEDALIQVNLPSNPDTTYYLSDDGDVENLQTYLFPFTPDILNYLSPAELVENTKIISHKLTDSLRVELKIPLENNYSIEISHEYLRGRNIIAGQNIQSAGLAVWPDFVSPTWKHYFYLKTIRGKEDVDFEPLAIYEARQTSNYIWYTTKEPALAFVGSINKKRGLLLLRNTIIPPPSKLWKVSVDIGSAHTRAFSLLAERRGDSLMPSLGASTNPIQFNARARLLTRLDPKELRDRFFALAGSTSSPARTELETVLMVPEGSGDLVDDWFNSWLPREGYIYTHWLTDDEVDGNHMHHDLKWSEHRDDFKLRAFLRCLLIMIQAEAAAQCADVAQVAHAYPTTFTYALTDKYNNEWFSLEQYLNTGSSDKQSILHVDRSSISEAVAVCRHLECEQGASPITNTLSIDIGVDTTDIAIWVRKELKVQESIKWSTELLNEYLQSQNATEFLKWLEATLRSTTYNLKNFSFGKFASKPRGYGLMFTSILDVVEWRGQLNVLIKQINTAKQSRGLISRIIYLYASLLYYAGLVARKAGLHIATDTYHLYFCGKGGTFVRWIRGSELLAQRMFKAGLFGTVSSEGDSSPFIKINVSRLPKEEVGRGLLAESALGTELSHDYSVIDVKPSVTVGETGYAGLEWDGELTADVLLSLPINAVPAMNALKELNTFLEAFKQETTTQAAAVELRLDVVSPDHFHRRLLQRLFGTARGCVIYDLKRDMGGTPIEPLFITEVKVLLEAATQGVKL